MASIALPGGPAAEEPIPETPIDGVDLRTYATIAGRLAARPAGRAEVLAGAGLTDARWTHVEQGWALRLATAALRRDTALLALYERAHTEAQDAICRVLPLDTYVALTARIAAGADPAAVLAEAGVTAAELGRTQRHWSALAPEDPEVARALRLPEPRGRAR